MGFSLRGECRRGLLAGDVAGGGEADDQEDVEGGHGQGAEEGGFTLRVHGAPPGTSGRA